ncbi:MAG TPA: flagellar basal body rod protein FlgF [Oleiagrimonas sp.]|nr:flagellar basal body rod protein FlgF [Oleiagrimonas sp.]
MDRMIYTAMSGAAQSLNRQAVISNNLANVSTAGFRAQLFAMRAVPVQGAGVHDTRVSVMAATSGSDFSPGPIVATGRPLDVAMEGRAWLAVQDAQGNQAYTRRGDLQVNGNGMITSGGHPVVGENGPIIVPLGSRLFIGTDGTISAIGAGENPDALAPVGRLKLVTPPPGALTRSADGLFRSVAANGVSTPLPGDDDARLQTGSLEGSNVSAVGSMVDMIANSRLYDMQMKVISSSDDNARDANRMLSL